VDRIEQQKIKEAKELLERYAPKGEFLAYINKKEAGLLKAYGGAGKPIEETNIPSFIEPFTMFAIAMAVSTAVTFMGSLHQAQNLKRASKWDRHYADLEKKQSIIYANEVTKRLKSQERANLGVRGVEGTGSPLLVQGELAGRNRDTLYWIELGAFRNIQAIDSNLALGLANNYTARGMNLMRGAYQTYDLARPR
jgi:hypothetical protein